MESQHKINGDGCVKHGRFLCAREAATDRVVLDVGDDGDGAFGSDDQHRLRLLLLRKRCRTNVSDHVQC